MKKSIIEKAVGDAWENLPGIIREHYGMVPGTSCEKRCSGAMDEVWHATAIKPFLVFGRLFKALVPYRGKDIPTNVRNYTCEDEPVMHWHRTFLFPQKSPLVFKSRLEYWGDDEIVEFVGLGLGARFKMSVEDKALVFTGLDYIVKMGPLSIRLPSWMLLGNSLIRETAVSGRNFRVDFEMTHPILKRTFAYSGEFTLE